MYYALFIIKLLTSVCNINHWFSSVQEIICCIAIYFCDFSFSFKSLNGRDSGKYLLTQSLIS